MNEASWDSVAEGYDEKVFDAVGNDQHGVLRARIKALIGPDAVVSDIGCGVGKLLPLISPLCSEVRAVDISISLLKKAEKFARSKELANVHFQQVDLSDPRSRKTLPRVDLAICVNMAITDSLKDRRAIFGALASSLKKGGTLLLVLPSLESVLYANSRLVQWNLRSGLSASRALKEGFEKDAVRLQDVLRQGVFDAGGVPTKHYLREELQTMFEEFQLVVKHLEKVTYPWTMEFHNPPSWMQDPYPWDWLVELATSQKA